MKVFHLRIRMGDKEWGNVLMGAIAHEAMKEHHQRPLVVTINEHAGWFLQFAEIDGEIITIGTANDMANFYGKAAQFREEVRNAEWINLPGINRQEPQERKVPA